MTFIQSQINSLSEKKQWKFVYVLSLVTIFYNLAEGAISTHFGFQDETLALFGFGVDSFVEVISGIGIAHRVWRLSRNDATRRDEFERTALKITGIAFYTLTVGLMISASLNIATASEPESTLAGIIVSAVSILTMYFLYKYKLQLGQVLNSDPVTSDAKCTKTCFYLSFILLASSAVYHLFKIPYIDAIGSLGIAWYAFKEGREAFEKASRPALHCDDDCC